MKHQLYYFLIIILFGWACKSFEATTYDYPNPVDTSTRPIEMQEKKIYEIDGVFVDNKFDGARLNNFKKLADNSYQVLIEPENTPINPSPYYAFRIWANTSQNVTVEIHYSEGKHRYWPKISIDGRHWQLMDSSNVSMEADSIHAFLSLNIGRDTLWVAAQELKNSSHVKAWAEKIAKHSDAHFSSIGKSKLGRDMLHVEISQSENRGKEAISIISRQHPPEVTGYLAMEAFVEELMENNPLSNAFRKKYRILVYPLLNPDGVDLGHWRHNAGGIDLNRDWAYYRQPEIRAIANHMVETSKKGKNKIILGLDFHSTYYDIYYTFDESLVSQISGFKDYWLMGIEDVIPDYHPKDAPAPLGAPVSKNWYYTQLKAEGITYEIGDDTPRDFIREKGKVSAREMMKLLILR